MRTLRSALPRGGRQIPVNRSKGRLVRLLTATSLLTAFTVGASPALAADAIPYYTGSATGQAVNLTVDPSSVLNVRLDMLQDLINQLDNALPGTSGSLKNLIGSTLQNPTAPIKVVVNGASANGVAAKGTELTDGKASSTPVAIDAASLKSELALLDAALKNMPDGTVAALKTALQPLLDANPTLKDAFNAALPELSHTLTDTLGAPTLDVVRTLNANFGEDKSAAGFTIKPAGILTPNAGLSVEPFNARAIAKDAAAANSLVSLDLVPTGQIGLANQAQLKQALQTLEAALVNVEHTVYNVGNSVGVGAVTGTIGNLVFPTVNGAVNSAGSTVLNTVDLNKVNALISQVAGILGLLDGLNGLQLNDIVAAGPANSSSTLQRLGSVKAAGLSAVADVDVLKVTNPQLASLLKTVTGHDVTSLAHVGVIKGSASVVLDGTNKAVQQANGQISDIRVLGFTLDQLTGGAVNLDKLLPPGTSCTIAVPGKSTCQGIPLNVPDVLGLVGGVTGTVTGGQSLLSINFTRGAGVLDPTANETHGSASITTLEISVDLNCGLVNDLAKSLLGNTSISAPVNMTLGVCGVGINTPTAPTGMVTGAHSGQVLYARNARLVDTALGVATATLSTTPVSTPGQPLQPPPTTGNNLLILAALGAALVAAGVGVQVWRVRTARI